MPTSGVTWPRFGVWEGSKDSLGGDKLGIALSALAVVMALPFALGLVLWPVVMVFNLPPVVVGGLGIALSLGVLVVFVGRCRRMLATDLELTPDALILRGPSGAFSASLHEVKRVRLHVGDRHLRQEDGGGLVPLIDNLRSLGEVKVTVRTKRYAQILTLDGRQAEALVRSLVLVCPDAAFFDRYGESLTDNESWRTDSLWKADA